MLIGVDFDNTIVCYDRLFHKAALSLGLIPKGLPAVKDRVRDHLRARGLEEAWTELQGRVYGPLMKEAEPFPGSLEFLARCRDRGVAVRIISHRTRQPFKGPRYDLHQAAFDWLEAHGMPRGQAHLETTKGGKLARIARAGCTHFIDDLPEFLEDPAFPPGVERILFDPNGAYARVSGLDRAASWAEIGERLFGDAELEAGARTFLADAGLRGKVALKALPGAANNRVFRAEAGGRSVLVKAYFRHEADPRDRLAAEFSFSRFAWDQGVRALPKPLACDAGRGLGVYEFIEGRRLGPREVTEGMVRQAIGFYRAVNRRRSAPGARRLPEASEACFSIAGHLRLVERRLESLRGLGRETGLEREAAEFVQGDLARAWVEAEGAARRAARTGGLPLGRELAPEERVLSPSDFGFHNALLTAEGRLKFIDFEYAGWDDPAKTVCDFFCQPELPVPPEHYEGFAQAAAQGLPEPRRARQRMDLLLDVYRVKWCCILLNAFLPAGRARRRFAREGLEGETSLASQLEKARRFLKVLERR